MERIMYFINRLIPYLYLRVVLGVLFFLLNTAGVHAQELIYSDDFESYTIGSSDHGFIESVTGRGDLTIQEFGGNKYLSLNKTISTSASFLANKNFGSLQGLVKISADISINQTGKLAGLIVRDAANNIVVQLNFARGSSNIVLQDDSGDTYLQNYNVNEWYNIEFYFYTENQKYDVYINGELREKDHAFRTSTDNVSKVETYFYANDIGIINYDNISVAKINEVAVDTVTLDKQVLSMYVDQEQQLTATVLPEDATFKYVEWSSGNEGIATVSNEGLVTAVDTGSVIITASTSNGKKAECEVSVAYLLPSEVVLDDSTYIAEGKSKKLRLTMVPDSATVGTLNWSSSADDIVTVTQSGVITGVKLGTATISVEHEISSKIAECKVTVLPLGTQATFFVSSDGDDNNDGSEQSPFATIKRARDTVRTINSNMTGDLIVNIKGGTYVQTETLEFDQYDSGTNGFIVKYTSFNNEKVVISGGKQVTGWSLYDEERNIYKASFGSAVDTRQLYINGNKAQRARSIGGLWGASLTSTGYTTSRVELADFVNPKDLELVYQDYWTNTRIAVDAIELNGNEATLTMVEPGWTYVRTKGMTSAEYPLYFENAYELITQPGEWYLDKTGTVSGEQYVFYYKPLSGENMAEVEAIAPVLETLISISSDDIYNKVNNMIFNGINFEHTTWLRPGTELGHPDAQNNAIRQSGEDGDAATADEFVDTEAGVVLKNVENSVFERCNFTKLGHVGLLMDDGCQNNLIQGSTFFDIAGTGIQIGADYYRYDTKDKDDGPRRYEYPNSETYVRGNKVLNNYISNIATEYKSATGLAVAYPVDTEIKYNQIGDIPYSAIHLGWGWTRVQSPMKNNVVQYNYIHDNNQEIKDGGGIYTNGPQDSELTDAGIYGTLISYNYLKNQTYLYASAYMDDGSDGNRVDYNVFDNVPVFTLTKRPFNTINNNHTNSPKAWAPHNSTTIVSGDAWNSEALAIIDGAGLQSEYEDIISSTLAGISKVMATIPNSILLEEGKVKMKMPEVPLGYHIEISETSDDNVISTGGRVYADKDEEQTVTVKFRVYSEIEESVSDNVAVTIPASNQQTIVIYQDDMENHSNGATDFGFTPIVSADKANLTIKESDGNKYINLTKNSTGGSSYIARRELESCNGLVSLRMDLKTAQNTAFAGILVRNADDETISQLIFKHDESKIALQHLGIVRLLQPNVLNKWYELEMVFNTNNQSYDIYIDDVLVEEQWAFLNQADSISYLDLYFYAHHTGNVKYDNIKIENLVPNEIPEDAYSLTVLKNGNGSVTPSVSNQLYKEGVKVNLSAIPDEGWEFEKWMIGLNELLVDSTTITMEEDVVATAYFIEPSSAISENVFGNIVDIYPIPVKDELTITFNSDDNGALESCQGIEIIHMSGQVLKTIVYSQESEVHVDCSNFNSGIYCIRAVTSNGYKILGKFVK